MDMMHGMQEEMKRTNCIIARAADRQEQMAETEHSMEKFSKFLKIAINLMLYPKSGAEGHFESIMFQR